MANERNDPPVLVDPIRLTAGRVLASDEAEGGDQAAIRPLHRLLNTALAEAGIGPEVSASWRPLVFYYEDPDPGGAGSTPESGPVVVWPISPPTDRHDRIAIVLRGVQGPDGLNGKLCVECFNGLAVVDTIEWNPPAVAVPSAVDRPPRSPVFVLDVSDPGDPMFLRLGVESDGDAVHVRGVLAAWLPLDDDDFDGADPIDGVYPFGVEESIDPGRPLPACRGRQATAIAEGAGRRGNVGMNYAAVDEPIGTATGGAIGFSSPPLGLVHASMARPLGAERPARYAVETADTDLDGTDPGGTVTVDGIHYARPVGDDPSQVVEGNVGEGARLLTIGGVPVGLYELDTTSDDDPEDITVVGVRIGRK